jgi:hypothetical protein
MISVLGGLSQELTLQKIKEKLEDVAQKQAEIARKIFQKWVNLHCNLQIHLKIYY